jgi:hypothetical protein
MAKKGNKRASMDVTECFASLLQWIIDLLPQTTKELPIAIDATSIEQSLISDRSSASFSISTPNLSCFINGLLTVIAQLLNGQSISFGRLFPLPFNHFIDLHFSNSS